MNKIKITLTEEEIKALEKLSEMLGFDKRCAKSKAIKYLIRLFLMEKESY